MKKLTLPQLILFIAVGIASPVFAQDAGVVQTEHSGINYVPSPQTWAFMKYGNTPVDYYTGTVQVNVPVYEYKDNDFDISVSAGYASNGLLPLRQTGILGLNWFLNCGGSVTREIRGVADDKGYGPIAGFVGASSQYTDSEFMRNQPGGICSDVNYMNWYVLGYNNAETESDVFHFNFMGHTGTFHYNLQHEVCIYNTNGNHGTYKIEYDRPYEEEILSFTIKTADGYSYVFGGSNESVERSMNGNFDHYGRYVIETGWVHPIVTWNLTKIIAPNGRTVSFGYASNENNNAISYPNQNSYFVTSFSFGYNDVDNGYEFENMYDRNGNPKYFERNDGSESSYRFGYYMDGNRIDRVSVSDVSTADQAVNHNFTYDDMGNITNISGDNLEIDYNFLNLPKETVRTTSERDRFGQMKLRKTYHYNRYLSDGTKVLSYDAAGDGYMYFGTARFTLDNNVPTFESIPFSGGRIVKTTNGYEPQYYLTDHLGSTRAIVNNDGQTVDATFDYTPFGVQITGASLPTNSTEYRFSGKELQNISDYEIYDFGARQYLPKYAVWGSVDPLSEMYYPITPYAYCANNPIKYIDPDGRKLLFASGVSEQFKSKFEKTIKFMNEHKTSGDIAKLHASETVYYIKEGDGGFDPNNNTILWNPQQIVKTDNCLLFPATILAHESKHALQKEENSPNDFLAKAQPDVNNEYGNKLEEEVITTTEQDAAKKHGDIKDGEVTRINHNGQIIEFTQKIPNGKILEDFRSKITLRYK